MSSNHRPEHFSLQHVPRAAAVLGIWWYVIAALGCVRTVHAECAQMCPRLSAVTSCSSTACFGGLSLDSYCQYYFEYICPVIVRHEHFCSLWGLRPVLLNLMPLVPPDLQFFVHQTSVDQRLLPHTHYLHSDLMWKYILIKLASPWNLFAVESGYANLVHAFNQVASTRTWPML